MSISTAQLHVLHQKLRRVAESLRDDRRGASVPLEAIDPQVTAAQACDFLLPSPLTLATLRDTVQKKMDNVAVLLERATMHEALPADARTAAEEDNVFMEANYDTPPKAPGDDESAVDR
ncbi:MAG: hypothetical protein NVSMB6_24960 [Burkholderiaceae bacterium]